MTNIEYQLDIISAFKEGADLQFAEERVEGSHYEIAQLDEVWEYGYYYDEQEPYKRPILWIDLEFTDQSHRDSYIFEFSSKVYRRRR